MKDVFLFVLTISLAVLIAVMVLAFISHAKYGRSLRASVVAAFFRLTVRHKSDEKVTEGLSRLPLVNDCYYRIPKRVSLSVPIRRSDEDELTVFYLNEGDGDRAIIYLYGGGYVRQPRIHHWKYFDKLAGEFGNVIVPIYPKAPNHHPQEAYEKLTRLYCQIKKQFKTVILMGDSSGGGLALGLCEYFGLNNVAQPDNLILYSPWIDLTLSNPEIEKYQKVDPLISAASEKIWAKAWAGDLSLTDYRVSPLYGKTDLLNNVTLFTGNREILYPDICLLHEKLKSDGVNVRLIIGKGMNHVYQIYPIPEAQTAFKMVKGIIYNKGAVNSETCGFVPTNHVIEY